MIPFFVGDPPWAGGEFPEVGPDGYAYMWVDNIWGGSELVKIDLDSGAKYMTPVWALFGGGYGGSAFPPQIQAGPAIPALGVSSMAALVILLGLAGVLALRRSL